LLLALPTPPMASTTKILFAMLNTPTVSTKRMVPKEHTAQAVLTMKMYTAKVVLTVRMVAGNLPPAARIVVVNLPLTARMVVVNLPATARMVVVNLLATAKMVVVNLPATARMVVVNLPPAARTVVVNLPLTARMVVGNLPPTAKMVVVNLPPTAKITDKEDSIDKVDLTETVDAVKLLVLTATTSDQPTSSKALAFPEARLPMDRSFAEAMSTTSRLVDLVVDMASPVNMVNAVSMVNTAHTVNMVNTAKVNTATSVALTWTFNLLLMLNKIHLLHLLAESTPMLTISSNALSMSTIFTAVTLSSTSTKCSSLTNTISC